MCEYTTMAGLPGLADDGRPARQFSMADSFFTPPASPPPCVFITMMLARLVFFFTFVVANIAMP